MPQLRRGTGSATIVLSDDGPMDRSCLLRNFAPSAGAMANPQAVGRTRAALERCAGVRTGHLEGISIDARGRLGERPPCPM
jgi:hypothetical protein